MLPGVVLLAGACVWAVLVVAAQLRCVDAAGVGARALARGESTAEVERVVAEVAPRGAAVQTARQGDLVVVTVHVSVRLPAPWARAGPAVRVGDRAVAVAEDSTGDAGAGPP